MFVVTYSLNAFGWEGRDHVKTVDKQWLIALLNSDIHTVKEVKNIQEGIS